MATEQVIDGVRYRTGQLNAKMQFHVARRIAPLITKLAAAAGQQAQSMTELLSMPLVEAMTKAVAELSDEDCDYVMRVCMSVVMREQNGHFLPAWNKAADQPQFDDITVSCLMQLTIAVLQDNLGSFMLAQGEAGQQAATSQPSVH